MFLLRVRTERAEEEYGVPEPIRTYPNPKKIILSAASGKLGKTNGQFPKPTNPRSELLAGRIVIRFSIAFRPLFGYNSA